MRICILSDCHATLPGLESILTAAKARGCEQIWQLGDLIDYGPQPNEVIDLLRERAVINLAGNHDLLLDGRLDPEDFARGALECNRWTENIITIENRTWLATLKPSEEIKTPQGTIALFHGSPQDPAWGYLDRKSEAEKSLTSLPDAKMIIVGHTHSQYAWKERADISIRRVRNFLFRPNTSFDLKEDRWVINVGSCGFGDESNPQKRRASWFLLDLGLNQGELRQETYDRAKAKAAFIGKGLSPDLERRV